MEVANEDGRIFRFESTTGQTQKVMSTDEIGLHFTHGIFIA